MSIGTGMTNKGKIAAGYKTALPPEADTRNDKLFLPLAIPERGIRRRGHNPDEGRDKLRFA